MPKIGMEPIRRSALVQATIAEIGEAGSLEVTVGQIAKRAGMSSALAHHYFGSKDNIFLAAMRHILAVFGASVKVELQGAKTPHERIEAIIRASFSEENFQPEVISAWLNFYVLAQNSSQAGRLLRVYQRRLHSNLVFNLRPLVGNSAPEVAQGLAAMIDGLYIRQALRNEALGRLGTTAMVVDYLDMSLRLKGAK
ncbi:choline-binding transcriptional repressor BetI [Actibacterium lipolyticum]|uniref:HTH-type transcriptional regulator BetI n=1 Tax=Actibacterium lipolyticum TaxID=1524263 RepID=A0A238KWF3_9RHOB|nr:transcriptional regulator BetI [Actibacterium lipolyticum]SMX46532.1 HTH-type transcriptional regulator BetI [Actibacterium lipolyticum]